MKKHQRKVSHRFVMYISSQLREQVEELTQRTGLTLAAFGRKAFENYVSQLKKEELNRELTQTCLLYQRKNQRVYRDWAEVEQARWPS